MRHRSQTSTALRARAFRARAGAFLLAVATGVPASDLPGKVPETPGSPATPDLPSPVFVPEMASGAAVDIQAALGFAGTYRLGGWSPLTVTLDNRRTDLSGHLEVRVAGGDGPDGEPFTNIHRRPFELPGDSRKRFHFTVYMKNFSEPIDVKVLSSGREVARKTFDLRSGVTNAHMLLVLGRNADLDYLNDPRGRRLRVLYPRVERLPEHWAGYDGVGAVVVHGHSLEDLSTRQYAALTKWLANGGVLAVSGGPDYGLLRTGRLARLLPGVPLGLERLADGNTLGTALGMPLAASRPFHVNLVRSFEGRVLHRAGDTPLVIARPLGRGRVLYLTFDISRYPFDGWPGMAPLWHRLLDLPPLQSLAARLMAAEESSSLPDLIQASPLSFPGHPLLFVFIVLYLGCIAAAGQFRPSSRGLGRHAARLRWGAPLVFAPAAFYLFGAVLYPSGPVAVIAALISPHPEGPLAELRLELGLFSTTDSPLRFEYRSPEPVFRASSRGAPAQPATDWWHQSATAGGSLAPATQGRYVLHALEGRDVIAWDLHASLHDDETGLLLEVRNRSGRSLHDAWLVVDGNAYALGSLPADADSARILDRERDGVALRQRSWRGLLSSESPVPRTRPHARAGMVERQLARLRERGAWSPHEALLLGFSPSPLRFPGGGTDWRRHELALVLLHIPFERRIRDSGRFRP